MSIFINTPNRKSLICVTLQDKDCLYSRNKMQEFKRIGYKGYDSENQRFTDELDLLLEDPHTIYKFDVNELSNEVFIVYTKDIEHLDVNVVHKSYTFLVPCLEKNKNVIKVRVYGEQFVEDRKRTVFCCNCCGQKLVITGIMSNFLRCINSVCNSTISSPEDTDLPILDTLKILAKSMSESEFCSLIGPEWDIPYMLCHKEIVNNGYPTFHNFYLCVNDIRP